MFDLNNETSVESLIDNLFSTGEENFSTSEEMENFSLVESLEEENDYNRMINSIETFFVLSNKNIINDDTTSQESIKESLKAFIVNLMSVNPFYKVTMFLTKLIVDFKATLKNVNQPLLFLRHADTNLVKKICKEIFTDEPTRYSIIGVNHLNSIKQLEGVANEAEKLLKAVGKDKKGENQDAFLKEIDAVRSKLESQRKAYNELVDKEKANGETTLNNIIAVTKFPDQTINQANLIVGFAKKTIFTKNLHKAMKLEELDSGDSKVLKELVSLVKDLSSFYKQLFNNAMRTVELCVDILTRIANQYKHRAKLFSEDITLGGPEAEKEKKDKK